MNGRNAITACLMLLPLAGCASTKPAISYNEANLGRYDTRTLIVRSVDAMGGLDELYNSVFRVVATVTIYDDAQGAVPGTAPATQPAPSGAVVWHTAMTIDPVGQTIEAKAPTGTGGWQAVLRNGRCDFRGQGQLVPPRQQQAICEMLNITLHRVSGPLNFVVAGEQARSLSHSVVDGEHVLRVGVSSSDAEIRAYYFNPRTALLQFATARSDVANQPGTITVYQWRKLPNGPMFPQSITVYKIGENVLIGPEKVLQVDFDRVRIKEVAHSREHGHQPHPQ